MRVSLLGLRANDGIPLPDLPMSALRGDSLVLSPAFARSLLLGDMLACRCTAMHTSQLPEGYAAWCDLSDLLRGERDKSISDCAKLVLGSPIAAWLADRVVALLVDLLIRGEPTGDMLGDLEEEATLRARDDEVSMAVGSNVRPSLKTSISTCDGLRIPGLGDAAVGLSGATAVSSRGG
jgi:hypothetical protein